MELKLHECLSHVSKTSFGTMTPVREHFFLKIFEFKLNSYGLNIDLARITSTLSYIAFHFLELDYWVKLYQKQTRSTEVYIH